MSDLEKAEIATEMWNRWKYENRKYIAISFEKWLKRIVEQS